MAEIIVGCVLAFIIGLVGAPRSGLRSYDYGEDEYVRRVGWAKDTWNSR